MVNRLFGYKDLNKNDLQFYGNCHNEFGCLANCAHNTVTLNSSHRPTFLTFVYYDPFKNQHGMNNELYFQYCWK